MASMEGAADCYSHRSVLFVFVSEYGALPAVIA